MLAGRHLKRDPEHGLARRRPRVARDAREAERVPGAPGLLRACSRRRDEGLD